MLRKQTDRFTVKPSDDDDSDVVVDGPLYEEALIINIEGKPGDDIELNPESKKKSKPKRQIPQP